MTLDICERFAENTAMFVIGAAYGLCMYSFLW